MSYTVAKISEADGQAMNDGLTDDQKYAFSNCDGDVYCLQARAIEVWGTEGEGKDYELVILSQTQVDGTWPLPKRRKLPV